MHYFPRAIPSNVWICHSWLFVYNSAAVCWQIGQPLRKHVTAIVQWKEEEGFWLFVYVQ